MLPPLIFLFFIRPLVCLMLLFLLSRFLQFTFFFPCFLSAYSALLIAFFFSSPLFVLFRPFFLFVRCSFFLFSPIHFFFPPLTFSLYLPVPYSSSFCFYIFSFCIYPFLCRFLFLPLSFSFSSSCFPIPFVVFIYCSFFLLPFTTSSS